jgi:hypothetical protein
MGGGGVQGICKGRDGGGAQGWGEHIFEGRKYCNLWLNCRKNSITQSLFRNFSMILGPSPFQNQVSGPESVFIQICKFRYFSLPAQA